MTSPTPAAPRTYFLNQNHELAHGEIKGGGSLPKLAPIDWAAKGARIHTSLREVRDSILDSQDPLRTARYFLSAVPASSIKKLSNNKRRAPTGILEEHTDYAGEHSRVFKRLGLDLLAVDQTGKALIHVPSGRYETLVATTSALKTEGLREQARWISIDSFEPAPTSFRIDEEWLEHVQPKMPVDAVVELQPLLTRVEVEQVIRAIIAALGSRGDRERFMRTGTDFSGRHWYRGSLSRESLQLIAEQFFSVQALHPPLQTPIAITNTRRSTGTRSIPPPPTRPAPDLALLPAVAVIDVGVPEGHAQLATFSRGRYTSPNAPSGLLTDHGSQVASRVVFGDPDHSSGIVPVTASCAFVDVNIAADAGHTDDKALLTALQAVIGIFPDVRVFNMSVGEYAPLSAHPPVERREKLLMLQDLDNFIFQSDVIVVIAAGNSRPGLVPTPNYPDHLNNPDWSLGSWACGFNTLKCGSYVGRLAPGGLVTNIGWPSPFTRIGPGLCGAPVPEFSANGGNCTDRFRYAPGLGVWAYTAAGVWEDIIGTSFAAPLLAREAAFAFAELQKRCQQGARPFAATVKAFLALTARRPSALPDTVEPLADRTIGRGSGSSDRLRAPLGESAVMLWQGVIVGPEDKARVLVPIPRTWLQDASHPQLRIIAAWESPVNEAVEHIWASRRVEFQLRPTPADRALRPRGRNHPSYPLIDREYDLSADHLARSNTPPPDNDFWVLDISYKEIAEYSPTVEFSRHQRIGVAMELLDEGDSGISPQAAMQALPQAIEMTYLTVPENRVANPVIVRQRV